MTTYVRKVYDARVRAAHPTDDPGTHDFIDLALPGRKYCRTCTQDAVGALLREGTSAAEIRAAFDDGPFPAVAREDVSAAVTAFVATTPLSEPEPPAAPEDTPANVRAERERRERVGEPHGYDALAVHFRSTPETIRRRLGKLK